MSRVPEIRVRRVNSAPIRPAGAYVLYWMTVYRRLDRNFALQRAVEHARALRRPLVILEALRCDYPWASDRFHRFVVDGMAANARRLAGTRLLYYPYLEPEPGRGRGLLEALAGDACLAVTDDFPAFFLPALVEAAGRWLSVRLEAVDSNGLLPLRATDRIFPTAHGFRRFLQRELPRHLRQMPAANPLRGAPLAPATALPRSILERWPPVPLDLLADPGERIRALPIDHGVAVAGDAGGAEAARSALRRFLEARLARYAEARNHPEADVASGLSPYLHFGHISTHGVFDALMRKEEWDVDLLAATATGGRRGWWGVSEPAEAFLDQLVTWRELGFNLCAHRSDYDRYESLPGWARATLERHAGDRREYLYTQEELEAAATHDRLWNAAQIQLVREGRIHNYLRMLWGKKILEWSPSPEAALDVMIELNNRYALDGRDPNSYSGIFWCLGRYDRPWGPERPIFGTVRYMSSENTARKYRVSAYVDRYAP